MTQKSLARQQRDQFAKNAKAQGVISPYDHLNNTYNTQYKLFAEYAKMVEIISHNEVAPFLQQPDRVHTLMKGFNADIHNLIDRTQALYGRHQDRRGMPNPTDEDEHFFIMSCESEYIMLQGVHSQNLLPVMLELDEHLRGALDAKTATQAQAFAVQQALDNRTISAEPTPA